MTNKFNKMMYKTYTYEDSDNLYVPLPPRKKDGKRYCCCVHVCKQFLDYPFDNWGRRIIPASAVCPFVKDKDNGKNVNCSGMLLSIDGKITTDTEKLELVKIYLDAKGR